MPELRTDPGTRLGRFPEEGSKELKSKGGSVSFDIPILKIEGSHAGY